jgi:hypothetical protein
MSTLATAKASEREVARPLRELVRLIADDLAQAREAAERAAMPHYCAAGAKLLEAKSQLSHGEFGPWLKRNFKLSAGSARRYMRLAEAENASALSFSSLSDFIRQTSDPDYHRPADTERWRAEAARSRDTIARLFAEAEATAEERRVCRALAVRLIDRGFKSLAPECHPDRGASPDAMTRLNRVRDLLKQQLRSLFGA